MNRVQLTAERRELSSKGYLKELRLQGKVPGVLYGRGGESLPLLVESGDLSRAISTAAGMNVLLNVELTGSKPEIAMIKELERDMLKAGSFTHVDFVRISLEDKIEVAVPIMISGEDRRMNDGGVIAQPIREVMVLSTPGSIPENFTVDVSAMSIGDSVTLSDLTLPEGCEAVTDAGEMLISILPPRVAQTEAAEEAAEEPADESEEQPE